MVDLFCQHEKVWASVGGEREEVRESPCCSPRPSPACLPACQRGAVTRRRPSRPGITNIKSHKQKSLEITSNDKIAKGSYSWRSHGPIQRYATLPWHRHHLADCRLDHAKQTSQRKVRTHCRNADYLVNLRGCVHALAVPPVLPRPSLRRTATKNDLSKTGP